MVKKSKEWCIIPSKMAEELSTKIKDVQFEFAIKYLDCKVPFEKFDEMGFYRTSIEGHDGVYFTYEE